MLSAKPSAKPSAKIQPKPQPASDPALMPAYKHKRHLEDLVSSGKLRGAISDYLAFCTGSDEPDGKRSPRFPNAAGFCRFLGIGTVELDRLAESDPDSHSLICAVLEDEALNSPMATTLITSYLKHRLGYDRLVQTKAGYGMEGIGDAEIVFEHDVIADGI